MSAIFQCAKRNDVVRLKKIIEEGMSLQTKTFDGETVLHIAALRGSIDVVKLALSEHIDINVKTNYFQETAVQLAIQEGHQDVFLELLNAGADLNTTNCEKETPIFTAVRWGREAMIPILISKGVDVDATNLNGDTPLAVALMFGNANVVNELIKGKAKTDLPCIDQKRLNEIKTQSNNSYQSRLPDPSPMVGTPDLRTPTYGQPGGDLANDLCSFPGCVEDAEIQEPFREVFEGEPERLRTLIDDGFNVNTRIFDDETALHVACELGKYEMAKILIDAGCDVNARTRSFQETPIEIAISGGQMNIVKLLLNANANLEAVNMEGETPIFAAVKAGNEEALDLLLEKKVNVNHENRGGVTPLGIAVMLREEKIVKKLIEAKSDVKRGDTNLCLVAQENGQKDIEAMIRQANPECEKAKPGPYVLPPPLCTPLPDNEPMQLSVPKGKVGTVQKKPIPRVQMVSPREKEEKVAPLPTKPSQPSVSEKGPSEEEKGSESGQKSKSAPKEEPKPIPKEEPKPAPKEEPKPIPKEEPKPAPKEEPKPIPKEEPKPAPKEEPKPIPKEEPKPAPKEEPKPAPKEEPKPAPKEEPKPAPKEEPKPAPKEEPKPIPKEEPKPAPKEEPKPTPKEEPKSTLTAKEEPKPVPQKAETRSILRQQRVPLANPPHHDTSEDATRDTFMTPKPGETMVMSKSLDFNVDVERIEVHERATRFPMISNVTPVQRRGTRFPERPNTANLPRLNAANNLDRMPLAGRVARTPGERSRQQIIDLTLKYEQLFKHIRNKDIPALTSLLEKGLPLNIIDEKEGVPLIAAIEYGNLEVVKLLVSMGADIDFNGTEPPFHAAIRSKKRDIVSYFLQCHVDIRALNADQETALYEAVRAHDLGLVSELVERGAEINIVNASRMSPLYMAVALKQLPIIKYLLNNHALPSGNGLSCMELAQAMHDKQLISVLVVSGARAQTRHANRSRLVQGILARTTPIRGVRASGWENGVCGRCHQQTNLLKFVPCGHVAICRRCINKFAEQTTQCPICHRDFLATAPAGK